VKSVKPSPNQVLIQTGLEKAMLTRVGECYDNKVRITPSCNNHKVISFENDNLYFELLNKITLKHYRLGVQFYYIPSTTDEGMTWKKLMGSGCFEKNTYDFR
jgi:hypothetical protein